MTESRNILRQITDVQVQAERLIRERADINEIEQFSSYSNEIKEYLINTIDDEFILNYIREIPDLNLDEIESNKGIIPFLLNLIAGGLGTYSTERNKSDNALKIIRDIRGKYASAEFMIKGYFN